MSMYDTLLNFSKMGEIGAAAEELNEEISEASKEWVFFKQLFNIFN